MVGYQIIKKVVVGTTNQITANGTGESFNVQGAKNFTIVAMVNGTGTAQAKIQGSVDGTNWYDIVTGTAQSTTNVTTVTSNTASNKAHSQARLKAVGTLMWGDAAATMNMWAIINW